MSIQSDLAYVERAFDYLRIQERPRVEEAFQRVRTMLEAHERGDAISMARRANEALRKEISALRRSGTDKDFTADE